MSKIAAIRIRGEIGVARDVEDALKILKLYRKNFCVVRESSPSLIGMLNKVKDRITYGEIEDDTYKLLIEKRGEEYKGQTKDRKGKISYSNKYIEANNKKIKTYFRLNCPKGGFERKGIKTGFGAGGVLGYRGKKINELIRKML